MALGHDRIRLCRHDIGSSHIDARCYKVHLYDLLSATKSLTRSYSKVLAIVGEVRDSRRQNWYEYRKGASVEIPIGLATIKSEMIDN